MDGHVLETFRRGLLQRRAALRSDVGHVTEDLREIANARDVELEEQAQEARAAYLLLRLDARAAAELAAIDRALARIADERFGECAACGGQVPLRRLDALPTTPYCRDCAEQAERAGAPVTEEQEEAPARRGVVPPDLSLLTERELGEIIIDHVRADGRIETDELRIVCRHGMVYVDGSVPSEGQHQILLRIITDVLGWLEVVDRVQVNELLWERPERCPEVSPAAPQPWDDSSGTEDIVQAQEEGTDYIAPAAPEPDEQ